MELRTKLKRDIVINKDMRQRFGEISSGFIFRERDLKTIFMLCLALGFESGLKKPISNPTEHITMNSFTDADILTIAAIAVQDQQDIKIVNNGLEMKRIAIEYANTGLDKLEELILEYGSGENLELAIEKKAKDSLGALSQNQFSSE